MSTIKATVLSILLVFSLSFSFSQTITGIVLDEKNEPIIGASVYFDGTTLGTTTDIDGKFFISLKNRINTSLVIRSLGYETYQLQSFYDIPNIKIQLTPKPYQIKEVVIKKDRFSRKQKMKIFKEEFLGNTKAGRSCIIQNENDISLYYNESNNTLYATSEKPLIIVNKHLGYTITTNLVEFNIVFNQTSIKREHIKNSLFLVTTFYEDKSNSNSKFNKRRNKSYLGSTLHFYRNIVANKWGKDEFLLFNGSYQAIPSQFFSVADTLDMKKLTIAKNTDVVLSTNNPDIKIPFLSTFNLLYKNSKQSKVVFKTNVIFIDKYGINTSPELIQFGGEMGKKRLGDLLPFDYSIDI